VHLRFVGEIVALVGASGSGKSTLFHLLENFYRPISGAVYLDGNEISSLDHSFLHQNIGIVCQEPVLMSGSIEDNILYSVVKQVVRIHEHMHAFKFIIITTFHPYSAFSICLLVY
jgi:ABC-type multidrug transport system fused ATPase/permease subunit